MRNTECDIIEKLCAVTRPSKCSRRGAQVLQLTESRLTRLTGETGGDVETTKRKIEITEKNLRMLRSIRI
ncbi:hypothetical protein Glove_22g92 [Diversispora epigaea]|uniref:Uncharacterized protein n=1 Tax=Diversispora epigaea TaxID=1348612 RepID=A0A397JJE4_9GLOM|nr:hypothetical protein Glove_22g92 [Diversispora epigaea]